MLYSRVSYALSDIRFMRSEAQNVFALSNIIVIIKMTLQMDATKCDNFNAKIVMADNKTAMHVS